jgi:DNA-directed RNA polymerase subunit alpha
MVEKLAAAQGDSPSGTAAVKLGIARYVLCQFGAAAELLAGGTDNKERRFHQALCHKNLRQWDKAIENFDYAEDRGWDAREVTLEKAETQALAGDIDAAGRTVERFAKSSTEDADWHYVKGLVLELRGEYDEAVERYEEARRLSPSHPGGTFRLAYYADLHGDEETAAELYREAITQVEAGEGPDAPEPRPIHANALLNLAVLCEDAGRYDDAERCLRRILSAYPNHARAQLFLKDVTSSRTMFFDEDEAKRVARRNDLLGIPVTDFELSVRARNCLKKMNIRTLGDLLHVTEPELLSYKNFGETSLAEIKQMLSTKSLRLGQLREEVIVEQPPTEIPVASVGDEGVLATPIAQIEFSVRARRALERLNVRTLGELANKSEPELLGCQNFGQTSLNEIQQRLAEYGFRLREAP